MAVYKFAGFWRRFVAFTIDSIILNIVFTILVVIASVALFSGAAAAEENEWLRELLNPRQFSQALLALMAFYSALSIAYFTFFHGMNGRTPGKMMLGLQVLSTDGRPIGFGTAFLRSVGYIISSFFYIGFIWPAFDKRKQGWHDKIAGTVVIIRPGEDEAAGLSVPESTTTPKVTPQEERPVTSESQASVQPAAPAAATAEDKATDRTEGI